MKSSDAGGDLVRGQAEIVVGVRCRRGDAEPVDADAQPVKARVALPAEGRARLDRDAQDLAVADVRQDVLAIIPRLRVETLGAGHGDHVGADPLRFKLLGGIERDLDFRAGREDDHLARVLRRL